MYLHERSAEADIENPVTRGGNESSTFGRYRLEREIGRGCSSIVYAAHDSHRHRAVALKVLTLLQTPDEGRQRDLAERFRREAQAVSTLSHPNIVAIYDVGLGEDGRQFIAMEYLPGETLRRRLREEAPLSVPVTVAIGVRVAEALHYAHSRGIIHRDVKPDNIFLADDGAETATPKLMDFGVAHVLSDQALTQDGMIIGSPAYMSPEQIHGLSPDARTDVFSLAVTLAEMATGVKPFEAETIPALMQKILHHDPDLRLIADRRLQRVLAKALAKSPGARYPDAWTFAQALRQLVPFAVTAPSIATQILPQAARGAVPARPRGLSRRGVVGFGGLALASLATLPFLIGHPLLIGHPPQAPTQMAATHQEAASPPQKAISPRMTPTDPVLAASPLPPHPVRRAGAGVVPRGAERQAHVHAQAVTSAYPLHHKEGDDFLVRIVERKPGAENETGAGNEPGTSGLPHPLRAALISRASRPPQRPATRLTASASAPAAQWVGAYAPRPAVLHWPMMTHALESRTSRPVTRVAAGRQEQESDHTAIPVVMPPTDSPPSPLSRPMPRSVDDLDLTDTTVQVRLSVSEHGEVTEADILRSSGSRALDDAAFDAVGRWRYAPAVRDGKPVPGVALETVTFAP